MPPDEHTALEFIRDFSSFEHDLKRSGFLTSRKGYAEADWDRYAKCIGGRFEKTEDQCLKEAIKYILTHPPRNQVVENGDLAWSDRKPDAASQSVRLLRLVRRVRNNLVHGEKPQMLRAGSGGDHDDRDKNLIEAGIKVLHYCKAILGEREELGADL